MTKKCVICGKDYEPKAGTESWSKNCYDCYIAGKVPPSKDELRHKEIMDALRQIYDKIK